MLELQNTTAHSADCTVMQDIDGARHLVVVVKASFELSEDGSAEISEPEEIVHDIVYNGEPGQSGIAYESDFAFGKPGTDVIVVGSAYGNGLRCVDVTLRIGPISKRLRVFGDRYWTNLHGTALSEPEPFDMVPVLFENAFGGTEFMDGELRAWEPRNPVGRGFATKARLLVGKLGPSIEYPDEPLRNWKSRPKPAGFGVVARNWQPRVKYAGTYDDKWRRERFPLLPRDYDSRFAQFAPEDQQKVGFLRGDEPVELNNMTPSGRWAFNLPRAHFAFTTRIGRNDFEHRSRLHTVILRPEKRVCTSVWCTSVRCHGKEHKIAFTTILEKQVRRRASISV